jgi:hypothetical protein
MILKRTQSEEALAMILEVLECVREFDLGTLISQQRIQNGLLVAILEELRNEKV